MFRAILINLRYSVPPKLSCSFRTRGNKKNPGIGKRLKILKAEQADITSNEISEKTFEDIESSDFMNARDIRATHKREITKMKRAMEFDKVERKYFDRQHMPNMLTWSEKEQIRQLHNEDPDTWTPEKLSMSFPANPHIIQKLLKNVWKPTSTDRILKHDQAVASNWKAFKRGKLKIPDVQLENHLKMFVVRDKPAHLSEDTRLQPVEVPKITPKKSEFGSIIAEYKTKTSEENHQAPLPSVASGGERIPQRDSGTYVLEGGNTRGRPITLEELRKKDRRSFEGAEEEFLRSQKPSDKIVPVQKIGQETRNIYKHHEDDLESETSLVLDRRRFQEVLAAKESYPLVIEIPERKWKKGATYRYRDTFYDDQGEFLYHVPGMTKVQ